MCRRRGGLPLRERFGLGSRGAWVEKRTKDGKLLECGHSNGKGCSAGSQSNELDGCKAQTKRAVILRE